ncbi:MAG TPA: histidine phosphatase family protein [Polyangiaceae bacterium]|nr:histidine phosphatase family protein [Polyangiaceae bacterium]
MSGKSETSTFYCGRRLGTLPDLGREENSIKTLLILRHAKAEPDAGDGDEARPLAKRGRRAAERVGELIADQLPDLILSSSSVRTRETVERLKKGAGALPRVEYEPELYLASPKRLVAVLAARGGDAARLLLVGHNPGLEDLVTDLTGERVSLPTAGLAECTLEVARWSDVTLGTRAELVRLTYPRDDD